MERVTSNIVNLRKRDKKDRNNIAREQLSQIAWPETFGTCLTSLHMCSGIILNKCKVMDSKQGEFVCCCVVCFMNALFLVSTMKLFIYMSNLTSISNLFHGNSLFLLLFPTSFSYFFFYFFYCFFFFFYKAPLWIEFQNADPSGANIKVMFKVGDDLRQDQMTLQFLDILDRKSLASGMDICFRPYRCAGTGHEVGMVEMVPNSDTIARMQWAGGGA